MAYTVKKLAELSCVSVRTLHFYDEIGLLPPAYVAANGYRYYEEEQLLSLQQILFFRELGFELKQVHAILSQPDFDKAQALMTHKEALLSKVDRLQELVKTIDKTIKRINGEVTMKDKEMYQGFSPEAQAEHEAYLVNRYGEKVKKHIVEAKLNTKDWTKSDWDQSFVEWDAICQELKRLVDAKSLPSSNEAQEVVQRHYDGIKKFWTPDHDSYLGLTASYLGLEWKAAFEKYDDHHPRLAKFLADAAEVFAKRNLS